MDMFLDIESYGNQRITNNCNSDSKGRSIQHPSQKEGFGFRFTLVLLRIDLLLRFDLEKWTRLPPATQPRSIPP